MGLFKTVSRRNNTSAWVNTPNGGENDVFRSPVNCYLNDSITTQETIIIDEVSSTSYRRDDINVTANAANSLQNRKGVSLSLHERQLREKDATIIQLRQTMEATEKVQSERIALLERQLERLVELPSNSEESVRQGEEVRTVLLNPTKNDCQRLDSSPRQEKCQSQLEMAALEELLARMIAEKDRLGFENKNLRSLLKQRNVVGDSKKGDMPPSIVELDIMIKKEYRKNRQEEGNRGDDNFDSNGECQEEINEFPSTVAKEPHLVMYQISYRHCPRDHATPPKYTGSFTHTNQTDSKTELTRILKAHYSQVWKTIQDENNDVTHPSFLGRVKPVQDETSGSGSLNTKDKGRSKLDNSSFETSDLMSHLVEHCKSFSNKEEVLQWCVDNMKAEIRRPIVKENRAPSSRVENKKKPSETGYEC